MNNNFTHNSISTSSASRQRVVQPRTFIVPSSNLLVESYIVAFASYTNTVPTPSSALLVAHVADVATVNCTGQLSIDLQSIEINDLQFRFNKTHSKGTFRQVQLISKIFIHLQHPIHLMNYIQPCHRQHLKRLMLHNQVNKTN